MATTTMTDSFKEVTNRHPQPGLEAVYLQVPRVTDATQPDPQVPIQETGKRRMTVLLYIAVGILGIAVIGLAVGLGVGLSRGKNGGAASPPVQSSAVADSHTESDSIPAATATRATTTIYLPNTATSTSTSSSSPTSSPTSPCPSANNTLITQSLGSMIYRIHCDSDFGGRGNQTLSSIVLPSFDECLTLCNTMNYFQDRTDVGCTYNFAGTGTQTPGTCWCLGGEGKTVVENVGNDVAVLVT